MYQSLTPGQQVPRSKEELVGHDGGANAQARHIRQVGFTVYMMVGLQGTGKTTTCVSRPLWPLNGKKPMLCACDV